MLDPRKFRDFLIKNDYVDVAIFLIISLDNLRNRGKLLKKDLDDVRKKMEEISKKISENPKDAVPENLEISQMFKDLHYSVLEAIQRINILIELLIVFLHFVRRNLRELPKAIGRVDISPKQIQQELDFLVKQDVQEIWRIFKYPNVSDFDCLNLEEQQVLKEILKKSAYLILQKLKEIYQFRQNFLTIYNKYKHTLSEITGIFGVDEHKLIIQSHIYIRHKVSRNQQKSKYYTFIVPISFDTLNYLDKIARYVWTLLNMLITNNLHFLVNEEKSFIPQYLFIENDDDRGKFNEICKKASTRYVVPNVRSKVIVPVPDPNTQEKINKALKVHHIYRMNKDVLDKESILHEGIEISKE